MKLINNPETSIRTIHSFAEKLFRNRFRVSLSLFKENVLFLRNGVDFEQPKWTVLVDHRFHNSSLHFGSKGEVNTYWEFNLIEYQFRGNFGENHRFRRTQNLRFRLDIRCR